MKVDFKKKFKELYSPPGSEFTIVDVPKLKYFTIKGEGNPNGSEGFINATQALFALSYFIKMSPKKGLKIDGYYDYGVSCLEGLWYADDPSVFVTGDKSSWKWNLMILQPEFVTEVLLELAKIETAKKKLPCLNDVKLENYTEGLSIQTMYMGSYSNEGPTIAAMHKEMIDKGYTFNGAHHEVYLGDPRKVSPEKLKTVLRQPIKRV